MTPDLWHQIDETFQVAVGMDPALRDSYLDDVCAGHDLLRSEVDLLLHLDSVDWQLLETPALESAAVLLADDEAQLEPGHQLGRYEIVGLLGRGGMGEVYHARDPVLKRSIALKLLHADHSEDTARLERFRREARAVSALNHPNILTIYELGIVDDRQFIATELIDGETLRAVVARGPLPVDDAVDVAIQIARALAAAHRAGIVHRDIKPENVMLRSDGYVKVLDFGLAKLAEIHDVEFLPDADSGTDISSMLMMGTPTYMSPEQVGGESVDARTDVFSLGTVLYEMLTGRPPFIGDSREDLANAILQQDAPSIGGRAHERLDSVLARMLAKDRESRYRNAEDALADLTLLASEVETKDMVSEPAAQAGRRVWAFAALLALLCASVLGYASYQLFRGTVSQSIASDTGSNGGTWVTKAPISIPRSQAAAAVVDDELYVAGGWDGRECAAFADVEAYDSAKDVWVKRARLNIARGGHGVAELGGRLYAVGGSVGCAQHISSVEAYEPENDRWSAKADLPGPRTNHVVAAANGKLYAIGGQSADGEIVNTNTEYDPANDNWTERAPMPTARSLAGVAVVHNTIYVIGGVDGRQPSATVEAYDPSTNTWSKREPMLSARYSFAVAEFDGSIYAFGGAGNRLSVEAYDPSEDKWAVVGELPARRHSFGAAATGGWIYLLGGYDDITYHSNVLAYSPPRHNGSAEAGCRRMRITRLPPMPTARGSATAGGIGGLIYVVGGYDRAVGYLATNESYDPKTGAWAVKARMPIERETSGSNAAVVGEKLYVIGGNAKGYCTSANQVYDPSTDSWTTLAPMPTPRCHSSAVAHDGLVYVMGGTNTNGSIRYSTVEVYDPATDKWTTAPPMPTARHHSGAVSLGGLIYVIGGWNPEVTYDSLNTVEAYDPNSGTWTVKSSLNFGRVGMAVGVVERKIIVIGGESGESTVTRAEVYEPVRDSWELLPEVPNARALASAVTFDDSVYAFGGRFNPAPGDFLTSGESFTLAGCSP